MPSFLYPSSLIPAPSLRADLEPALDASGLARDMEGMFVRAHQASPMAHVQPAMPQPIERSILKQNVKFLHNRLHSC